MKLFTGLLVLAFALCAYSQEETLLSVQDELAHTHRFFETIMGINRGQLSAYMYRVTRAVLYSHLDTYEFIFVNGQEAREHILSLEPSNEGEAACLAQWNTRFELQKQRFGQRLARCVGAVSNILFTWNDFTNSAHGRGQLAAAQIQNYGFNIFAETQLFDGEEDFAFMMKARLRDSIFRILGMIDEVEDFIREISSGIGDIEFDFIRCDRELEQAVMEEIQFEVSGAEACVGGGGGIDPEPTN